MSDLKLYSLNKSAVTLVKTQFTDFEALVAIRIEAMSESLERLGRFDPIRVRERFREGFTPEFTRYIEAFGERVGFVVVKPYIDGMLLDHLYIKPGAQGMGIGSVVLRHIFMEVDVIGLSLKVGALKESASNRFYTRHGFQFVESSEFDNYYVRHYGQSGLGLDI
ncbi:MULTISPECIES: GNAT family N-acetyltransferase [Acinetobacter]|uniref:GNAT family N-acetyltransferase n=1 Tax=Acinetobacter TaxID=469 RepID=UPI001E3643A0|nr:MULTISPECIES: GNAT family N-acetyltransferase [Acinetobacter]